MLGRAALPAPKAAAEDAERVADSLLSSRPGVHRAEEGHGEDVRHEVHEQAAVHREGRGAQRVPGAGDPAGDRARVPGESLVSSSPRASQSHTPDHSEGSHDAFSSRALQIVAFQVGP